MIIMPFLFGSRSALGVDIGTVSIKIAEIRRDGGGKPSLLNYGVMENMSYLKRPNSALQTNTLKLDINNAAEMLKMLLGKMKIKSSYAVASVPIFSSFTSFLELPRMTPEETRKAMNFQIQQNIPLPVSEVSVDWMKIGEREDENGFVKQQMLVIAIPNAEVAKYREIFKAAGLALSAIELESLSVTRSLVGGDPVSTLLVDIGGFVTNISVAHGGVLRAARAVDYAGQYLTHSIATSLSIDHKRAEDLKRQKGIMKDPANAELSTLTLPLLDVILGEAEQVKNEYENRGAPKIERVILCGGGSNLLGIKEYAESRFSLPTVVGNPFHRVEYPPKIEPMMRELGPELAVAVGLGMR